VKTHTRSMAVLLLVISAVASGGAVARADDASDRQDPSTIVNKYGVTVPDDYPDPSAATPEAVDQFAEAAKSDGVSESDIESMKSSGNWVAYPVKFRVTKPATSAASSRLTAGAADVAAASDDFCRSGPKNAKSYIAENALKKDVYKFTMGHAFCYDPLQRVITSKNDSPYIHQWIAVWAQAAGWSWEGLASEGSQGPVWQRWERKAHGAVYTRREGKFKYCAIKVPIACIVRNPWVDMTGYGNGTNYGQVGQD